MINEEFLTRKLISLHITIFIHQLSYQYPLQISDYRIPNLHQAAEIRAEEHPSLSLTPQENAFIIIL